MKIKDAVAQRIIDLCKEKNIAINALGNISGVNPSTIYSILNTKSQNPGVVTLQKICDGLEISCARKRARCFLRITDFRESPL